MIVSLVLSLKKKNNTCNKIGLGLALASAFLIITEIMAILGGGYGILMVIAFVAILYGIYKFFSDLWNGRQNGKYHLI